MNGKAKFEMRQEPIGFDRIAGPLQIVDHFAEILPHKVRQQKPIVQLRAPANAAGCGKASRQNQATSVRSSNCCVRLIRACGGISNARNSTSPKRPGRRVGRVQLVDAELGPVRVAGHVDQQMAKDAIDQPRRRVCAVSRIWRSTSSKAISSS